MTVRENPGRLVESSEFGDALRAVKACDFSADRLDAIRQAIGAQIALPAPCANVAAAPTVSHALVVKIGVSAIVAAVGIASAVSWYTSPRVDPIAVREPVHEVAEPIRTPREDIAPSPPPLPPQTRRTTGRAEVSTPRENIVPENAGSLAEELALFDAATNAERAGDLKGAVLSATTLIERHRDSELVPEMIVRRATWRAKLGQTREAIADLEVATKDDRLRAKRIELLRFLGDLLVESKDCERARDAFRRAIGLGAQGPELERARSGIDSCAAE